MAIGQEASPSESRCTYHVFLSFRGKDIGKTFVDHLYTALLHTGICTFRYDNDVERGENIKSEVRKAIKQSRISVVVFSKNYAASAWCLDVLVRILECKRTVGHKVLPVFYDVEPGQVREQTGSFAEAFSKHEERFIRETLEKKREWMHKVVTWRETLREVVDLGGMIFPNEADGHESKFVKEIVRDVESNLNRVVLNVARYPVGINYRAQSINLWLQDESADVIIGVICGMGGIGKTTIAKTVYNWNFHRFEGSSFLANIRETSEHPNGLARLQRQLLSDVLKRKIDKISNVDEGITKIKNAICCKKVLLVLDDVDDPEQIDAVFGMRDWFHPGSKIIITTRNEHLLKANELHKMFRVMELDDDESLKLFSWHAFGEDHPVEGYVENSMSVVQHCGGLPLALQVLGSSLSGSSVDVWQSALKKLETISDNNIQKKLEISYTSLKDDHDRNLFLHIACFFVGKDRDYVVMILDKCNFFTVVGLENLMDRCLVDLDIEDKLMMHQLVQDMGREIVRQESPREPGKRTRVWHHKDSCSILRNKTGTETIRGLVFDMRKLKEDKSFRTIWDFNNQKDKSCHRTPENVKLSCQVNLVKRRQLDFSWHPMTTSWTKLFPASVELRLKTDAFAMMHNLTLLQLNYAKFSGGYENFPKMLRWLCWRGFPLEYIPSEFALEGLVAIDMRNSSLKRLWRVTKVLESLKILNLSYSYSLTKTPDFLGLPILERLILKNCTSLIEVHESIGDLQRLLLLNLRDCKSLRKLPRRICQVKSLRKMILSGCSKLETLPADLYKLDSLTVLHVDRTAVSLSHSTLRKGNTWDKRFWSLVTRPSKSLNVSLISLPRSLVKLSLWNCNISVIPRDLHGLPMLERLDLGTNPIASLPESIKHLTRLQRLRLDYCTNLESLPELPLSLKGLNAGACTSLERITNLPNHGSGLNLELFECPHLNEVWGRFKLEPIGSTNANAINELGLMNLESIHNTDVEVHNYLTQVEKKGPVQGLFEFDIFNTFLHGNEVPEFFSQKSTGSLLSFILPSLLNLEIRGLNVCIVYALLKRDRSSWMSDDTALKINNETTGRKWIYEPLCVGIPEADKDMLWLSHWKFGKQLEGGHGMIISVDFPRCFQVKQIGVHIVYNNLKEKNDEAPSEENMIEQSNYYSSQSFFDRDLSAYQMSTGAYLLTNHEGFFHERCSGENWSPDMTEITWLTDEEEDEYDDDESMLN